MNTEIKPAIAWEVVGFLGVGPLGYIGMSNQIAALPDELGGFMITKDFRSGDYVVSCDPHGWMVCMEGERFGRSTDAALACEKALADPLAF